MRVALATTHPIQYQVPWFRALAERSELDVEVGFACLPEPEEQGIGFGVPFSWDLPLLDGYRWRELERAGNRHDLSRFGGLRLRRPGRWLDSRFDALVVTGWNSLALLQLAMAARRRGIPVIARGDSRGGLPRPLHIRLAHRLLLRLYRAFLVVGTSNRSFYLGYGVAPERLFACPHFVDNSRFARASSEARSRRAELRARWGVPSDAVCALFAGKIAPVKNLDGLLAALEIAAGATKSLHLLIVGEGAERRRLEQLADERSLPVSWAGFVNQGEMPAAYAAADFLVLPSHSETWGLAVNEAMACGLPALVSDAVGCAPDLIIETETGWTFPALETPSMAARLVAIARLRAQLPEMGERARSRVASGFSVDLAVRGVLAALESLASNRRPALQ